MLKSPPEKCKESVFEPPILLQNQANPQILLHFQAKVTDSLQKSGAQRSRAAGSRSGLAQRARAAGSCCGRAPSTPLPGEKPRPLAAVTHKKARYPHEVDTGRKARLCS